LNKYFELLKFVELGFHLGVAVAEWSKLQAGNLRVRVQTSAPPGNL